MSLQNYASLISDSGYDFSQPVGPSLWIPNADLQKLLAQGLVGTDVSGKSPRTRSKFVKGLVCSLLGYPVPKSFRRTAPTFLGQNFDLYIQEQNNLQIWNPSDQPDDRRYVILGVENGIITGVKVISTPELGYLTKSKTFTRKYQARSNITESEVVSPEAEDLFEALSSLVGQRFEDDGIGQERRRGAALHRLVSGRLGCSFKDNGRFPDIPEHSLELKLQLSSTIDLGCETPDQHPDVRYAVFSAALDGGEVVIKNVVLTTGRDFFGRFPQCMGKVVNRKIQVRLPKDFFD